MCITEGGVLVKQTERNEGRRAALGAAVTLAVYPMLLGGAALLLERGRIGEGHMAICAAVCAFLAALAGAATAARGAAKPAVPVGLCVGAALCAVLLLGLLTNDAPDAGRIAALCAAMAVGGGCALLPRRAKRGKRRVRRAHR